MIWNKDLVIIKDNFFEEALFKKIQADLDTSKFENMYGVAKGGNSRKIYYSVSLSQDHPAHVAVKSFFKAELGIIVKKMESLFLLSTKHKEPTPHDDLPFKINCTIYLRGGSLVHNGTALYEKNNEGVDVINSHIGFKENRMVMFSAEKTHASLQFAEGATGRFIMGNFIEDYELE